ncbi:hypothetical protein C0580_01645 [Candidatus Parcubacteria bacterium]|nr:MAG: hypothetical protein C0580_01645 [Candidatus Parcubacteria bacterium]
MKKSKKQKGFSFIELIIAVSIILIIAAVFVVNVRLNTQETVVTKADKLASDIRYIRNLVISRAEYQFEGQAEEEKAYPPGGYGVYFNGNLPQHKYFLFADSGETNGYQGGEDEILYEVLVDPLKVDDQNGSLKSFWFTFVSEHEVRSNMGLGPEFKFTLNIREDVGNWGSGYQATLILGEMSSDGYVWSNLGTSYGTFNIPKPDDDDDRDRDLMMDLPR